MIFLYHPWVRIFEFSGVLVLLYCVVFARLGRWLTWFHYSNHQLDDCGHPVKFGCLIFWLFNEQSGQHAFYIKQPCIIRIKLRNFVFVQTCNDSDLLSHTIIVGATLYLMQVTHCI